MIKIQTAVAEKYQEGDFQRMKKHFFGVLFVILFLSGCSNDAKTDSGVLSNATPTLVTPTGLEISPPVSPTTAPPSIITPSPTQSTMPTDISPPPTTPEISTVVPPTITEMPTTIPTITNAPTVTPTTTPEPTPTITQAPTPTPTPTPTPLLLAEGEIPLSQEYFPDEAFRGLLSALIDVDKNGILTLEEREQLTELRNTYYDMENSENEEYYYVHEPWNEVEEIMYFWLNRVVSLEGIEYFPKLRFLAVDEGWERDEFFDSDGQMKYLESFHAENMPELESVQLLTKIQSVTIKNAPKLRYLYILPDKSVGTCKITLEDCDSVEGFEYYAGATPIFDCRLENLHKLALFIPGDVFFKQANNAFDFSGLNRLSLGIQKDTKEIIVQNIPKLEKLEVYCDGPVFLSNLNALEELTLGSTCNVQINSCDNIKNISMNHIKNVEFLDFSGLEKLEFLYCGDSLVKGFRLFSPYTKVAVSTLDTYIDYCGNPQILAPRVIPDTDTIPADINYKPITISGVTECDCTGKTGYIIDLDGDGVEEQLYSDETGFYINGVNQGFARHKYEYDETIWNCFYLVDADRSDGKINVILNAESLSYLRSMYYENMDLDSALAFKYGSFGQYLAAYENSLTLIGYAESRSYYDKAAEAALFSGAVYDGNKGLRFQVSNDDTLDFRGIRNGFVVQNAREIELFIAEDGMVEVSDTFLSEGTENNLD